MLKIGDFAGLTGLTVKALRHYDETGVLVPANVDDRSAYRLYDEGQVRAGTVIRALRDAGVPLPAVAAAVAGGEAEHALESHRARVIEQREPEDHAFREAVGYCGCLPRRSQSARGRCRRSTSSDKGSLSRSMTPMLFRTWR